ncbi:ATPase, T2SS/T4P/T4SS family [Streptomyces daliensis]
MVAGHTRPSVDVSERGGAVSHPKQYTALPAFGVIGEHGHDTERRHRPQPALPGPADLTGVGLPTDFPAEQLRRRLRQMLSTRLAEMARADDAAGRPPTTAGERRTRAEAVLIEAAEEHARARLSHGGGVVAPETEQHVITQVLDELFGMAGLEPLLRNPRIENINVNGTAVFVRYADGRREQLPAVTGSDAELIELIRSLAARSGMEERRFDRGTPGVSFHLPGGERAFAVMAVTARPSLSIRRHRFEKVRLADLRQMETIDQGLETFLRAAVRARKNILVTGGTAIGKTTMLRALASEIPPWERLITIEDTFELGLDADRVAHPDVVAMQAREANVEGRGTVSQAELVRWALRMSPDRVIVGEVRGPEVIPMCNAMSQGNDGSMGTLHSSSSRGAFTKLAAYAVQGVERRL